MPEEEKLTTIKLKTSTRAKLADFGKKSETFDQIVLRLLNEVEHCRKSTG
jgi:SET domain-containing protein